MGDSVQSAARPFHMLIKPTGARCNLACDYCFYLEKHRLYPESRFRMSNRVLEEMTRQLLDATPGPEVTVAWQGGEPTLMGLDFFKRAVALQESYRKPHQRVRNTIQTNGILLDDHWCAFFSAHDFLVGLSLDGPAALHDVYRRDRAGNGSHERVMKALDCLHRHQVAVNALTTVNAANCEHPLAVYRFLDRAGIRFVQFIPIVERKTNTRRAITGHSVTADAYGRFLTDVFDEWVQKDVGRMFVQLFDVTLEMWTGRPPSLCLFAAQCGHTPVMEHNGDVYACDHFVSAEYRLGNILDAGLADVISGSRMAAFGRTKSDRLPAACRDCDVRFACHGGCPKHRFVSTSDGESGMNHLCGAYRRFFHHVAVPMDIMTDLLSQQRPPSEVMAVMAEKRMLSAMRKAGRNDPCPCGSGKKYKHCHGR